MLPKEPESEDAMRARYAQALEGVWTPAMGVAGDTPGKLRRHTFDWPDGLRLIVSMDDLDGKGAKLHVSGSSYLLRLNEPVGLVFAEAAFTRIAGRPMPRRLEATAAGVMHWLEE